MTTTTRTGEAPAESGDSGSSGNNSNGNGSGGGRSSNMPIGLGVGLGVGIPLTLGVLGYLAFLFWKTRRDGPKSASTPEQESSVWNDAGSSGAAYAVGAVSNSREKPELAAETPRPRHELEGEESFRGELPP